MENILTTWLNPSGDFNQLSLVWLGSWSVGSIFLVTLLCFTTLGLGWYNTQKLNPRRKGTLFILRVLTLGLFFIFK